MNEPSGCIFFFILVLSIKVAVVACPYQNFLNNKAFLRLSLFMFWFYEVLLLSELNVDIMLSWEMFTIYIYTHTHKHILSSCLAWDESVDPMFIVASADRHHGAFTFALLILSLSLYFFARISLREIFSQQSSFIANATREYAIHMHALENRTTDSCVLHRCSEWKMFPNDNWNKCKILLIILPKSIRFTMSNFQHTFVKDTENAAPLFHAETSEKLINH